MTDQPENAPELLVGVGRDMSAAYVGLVAVGATTLFVTAYSYRRVSASDYGVYTLVLVFAVALRLFDNALRLPAIAAVARLGTTADAGEREEFLREIESAHGHNLLVAAFLILAVGVAFIVLGATAAVSGVALGLIGLLGLAAVVDTGSCILPAVAVGSRRFDRVAEADILGSVVRIVVVIAAIDHLGVIAIGVAEVCAIAVERVLLAARVRSFAPWFDVRRAKFEIAGLRNALRLSVPLFLLSLGTYVVTSTDLLVLGVMSTTAIVGIYRIANLLPAQIAQALWTGEDAVFPALAGHGDRRHQEEVMAWLTRLFSYFGGLVLALVAFERVDVVRLLTGGRSELAETVLPTFCAIWMLNLAVRGLAVLLTARGRQGRMVKVIVIEAIVNLALTIILVDRIGAKGAAIASAVVVVVYVFVFPLTLRAEVELSPSILVWRTGILPAVIATLVAGAATAATSPLDASLGRLVVAATLTAVAGIAVAYTGSNAADRKQLASLMRARSSFGSR